MAGFNINFLDHVAIRVNDMAESIAWYKKAFGLKPYSFPEWGEFPVFMLSGKTGIALFPGNKIDQAELQDNKSIRIDHFAFNVSNENYQKAKLHWKALNIEFKEQDHHYFHSIYTKDPDGHDVELTTLVVDESSFYNQ